MADKRHLERFKQGRDVWNQWRSQNPEVIPDLSNADFEGKDLKDVNLVRADLSSANLAWAYMRNANLQSANLQKATFDDASLIGADLSNSNCTEAKMRVTNFYNADLSNATFRCADLTGANFYRANLTNSDLQGATLRNARLVYTNLKNSNLANCKIHGISAWNLEVDGSIQTNLVISHSGDPLITVDNLEVAQFIYLLLHNEKIRDVINTVGKKAVLLLGRFSTNRKAILDLLKLELQKKDYISILFDFEKPSNKDLTETVSTLAHLSRFVIADITDVRSVSHELQAIVPNLPSVIFQPLIHVSDSAYSMLDHLNKYPWVLPVYRYEKADSLVLALHSEILPAMEERLNNVRNQKPN